MTDAQAMTRVEGEALLEYLRGIPAGSWDTQTVCNPWSVKHLVAHLTALGNQTMPNFAKRMVMTGFNFQKVVEGDLQSWLQPTDTMLSSLPETSGASVTACTGCSVPGPLTVRGYACKRAVVVTRSATVVGCCFGRSTNQYAASATAKTTRMSPSIQTLPRPGPVFTLMVAAIDPPVRCGNALT